MEFKIDFNNKFEVVREFDSLEEAKECAKELASYTGTDITISDAETGENFGKAVFYGMPVEKAQAGCDEKLEIFVDLGHYGFYVWAE